MERVSTFKPHFYHPVWLSSKPPLRKEVVLVCSSGGIDSGLSAVILQELGYNVKLIHFDYGQKGEIVERFAVEKLAEKYKMDYEVFDLSALFKTDSSMLIRDDIKITTGEDDFIKSTAAWVSNRNGVFLSYLVTRAEQLILGHIAGKVYIVSGMSNLSEEGFYPDNSEYFIRSFFESVRYSTITSNRIEYVPLLQNIMKAEEWILGDRLRFPFELTASCDSPRIKGNVIELCNQCGSTQLSKWAAEMAGVVDPRKFYDRDESKVMEKKFSGKTKKTNVVDVINRIKFIREEDANKLLGLLC
jgi:queuosine biosynthesis protein QueC